ncbi:AraC family transcriptional regulator [Castellaniella sp. GW247-6E4]|uniref:helix-turn-helix transcriptional regulator n=1 Tax=Castellaniella sp. GW247-6E4 TaxID=3140380 RepID=UPI0033150218
MKRPLELMSAKGPREHRENNRIMVIRPDAVFYLGLLGKTSRRSLGSLTVYLAVGEPFRFRADDGQWEERESAVVAPYLEHQIVACDRVGVLLIEPEFVDMKSVIGMSADSDPCADLAEIIDGMTELTLDLGDRAHEPGEGSIAEYMDVALRAQFLHRGLDSRIGHVVAMIRDQPWERFSAQSCAAISGISVSRFLHLFKSEIGTTFRRFIAWKRVRCALEYVKHQSNLTDIALELGYPDSTHFSHSIRKAYGFSPRTMFYASRYLSLSLESGHLGSGTVSTGRPGHAVVWDRPAREMSWVGRQG